MWKPCLAQFNLLACSIARSLAFKLTTAMCLNDDDDSIYCMLFHPKMQSTARFPRKVSRGENVSPLITALLSPTLSSPAYLSRFSFLFFFCLSCFFRQKFFVFLFTRKLEEKSNNQNKPDLAHSLLLRKAKFPETFFSLSLSLSVYY